MNTALARETLYATDENAPAVWLINEPLRWSDNNTLERWMPLETLANFGRVIRVLPDGFPPAKLDGYTQMLREALEDWRDGDFLACIGDQLLLIATAFMIGGMMGGAGTIKTLKWSRKHATYEIVVINIGPSTAAKP